MLLRGSNTRRSRLWPQGVPALLFCVALLAVGCGGASTTAHSQNQPEILRWGIIGVPDVPTLDPTLASDPTSISLCSLIYGGLVKLDAQLRVRPDGASSWTISRNGRTYTFVLRRNLRFADGTVATAQDFVSSITASLRLEESAGSAPSYLGLISPGTTRNTRGVTALNARTVQIRLIHPAAHFLSELAFPASYVPEAKLVQRYGANWTDHAAGFGPFMVKIWRHSRYLTLQRNPYYYGGKPVFKRVSVYFYDSERSATDNYRRGTVNVISGLPAGQTFSRSPPGVQRVPALALDYLAFNTKRLPFFRMKARRALAAAWRPPLATPILGEAAFPASSFLPPGLRVESPLWSTTTKPSTWLGKARYRHKSDFPHVTLVMQRDPHVYALAQALSLAWYKSMGLTVPVRQLNPSDYDAVLNAHAFDLAIVRWGGDYPDPQDFLGTQLGASSDNVTGWGSKTYARLVSVADSYSPTDARRELLFRRASTLAADKVPLLPLDEPAISAIISPRLKAVQLSPLGTIVVS